MPKFKGRTTERGKWTEEDLSAALKSLSLKDMTFREAAERYGVPKSTLHERFKKYQSEGSKMSLQPKLGRFESTFTPEIEQNLAEYALELDRRNMGLSKREFLRLAFDLAVALNLAHRFNTTTKTAGHDFYKGFMKRNSTLSLRKPQGLSVARNNGFNLEAVKNFYDLLGGILTTHKIPIENIYNADETGIMNVHKHSKVISHKKKKNVCKLTAAERGKHITIMFCLNAAGKTIPPFFIFKGKENQTIMKKAPENSRAVFRNTSWMTGDVFLLWLEFFVNITKPKPESPVLLILDGHSSHKVLSVVEFAKKHHVIMLSLPPHTTHKLQPLDCAFMKPFKSNYEKVAEEFSRKLNGSAIMEKDVPELVAAALPAIDIEKISASGFKCTGISPLCTTLFDEELSEKENKENENPVTETLKTLLPLPQTKPKTTSNRCQKSEVLTSTPYVNKKKEACNKRPKNQNNNELCEPLEAEDRVLEDCELDDFEICCECYVMDNATGYVMCDLCERWLHEDCAVLCEKVYLCNFCNL